MLLQQEYGNTNRPRPPLLPLTPPRTSGVSATTRKSASRKTGPRAGPTDAEPNVAAAGAVPARGGAIRAPRPALRRTPGRK